MVRSAVAKNTKQPSSPGAEECLAMGTLCLSSNLRRTERLVTRVYDEYLLEVGISAVHLPILAHVAMMEAPTVRTLTEELELERSTLSRNLALLRRRGLIELGSSSGPKPGLITLTAKGRTALRRGHEQWLKAHEALRDNVDDEAASRGLQFLKQLRSAARAAPKPSS
jgi:DNA-binding MarR family transcriptional regulator